MGERVLSERGYVKPWTDEESSTLEEIVKKNRDAKGLKAALEISSSVLGRNLSSCKNRWYTKFAPPVSSKEVQPKGKEVLPAKSEKKETKQETEQKTEQESNNLSFVERIEKSRSSQGIPAQMDTGAKDEQFFEGANVQNTEVMEPPYIKIEIKPITRAQLDCMTEAELFDLMLNLTIKMQEMSNDTHADNRKLHRDLLTESSEKEEYKVGYTSLLGVINTARQMAVESIEDKPARFKMDKNGNLESIR